MAYFSVFAFSSTAETNEKSRILLKTKADEYLNRAEAVRQHVDVDTRQQSDVPGMAAGNLTAQLVILDVSAMYSALVPATAHVMTFVQEAFKCAKQAIDADASQNYVEAYKQYMKSMDYFMFAQRCL